MSAYTIPKPGDPLHPQLYYDRVVEYPEHEHLKDGEVQVGFLLVRDPVVLAGRQILGAVHLPNVQGRLRGVFQWLIETMFEMEPDFLMLLDKDYWEEGDDLRREILMFHEMSHIVHLKDKYDQPRYHEDTGLPVFGLAGHDVEEFTATVARYGAYDGAIQSFVEAANAHTVNAVRENNGIAPLPAPKIDLPDRLDPLYWDAVQLMSKTRRATVSGLQRHLKIGYNRAAHIIEQLEVWGIIGPRRPEGGHEILIPEGTLMVCVGGEDDDAQK